MIGQRMNVIFRFDIFFSKNFDLERFRAQMQMSKSDVHSVTEIAKIPAGIFSRSSSSWWLQKSWEWKTSVNYVMRKREKITFFLMLKSGQVDFYIDLSLLKSNNYLSNSYVVSGSVCFLVTQEVCVVVSVFQDMGVWSLK